MAAPKRPKITSDWDEQRKKIRLLNLVGVAVGVIVVILAIVFLVRGHY